MNKKIIFSLLFTVLLGTGCSNHLENENEELKKQLAEKEEQLINLENAHRETINEMNERRKMEKWSYVARLENGKDTFNNLEDIYHIHSAHEIKNNWYVLNEEKFQMEKPHTRMPKK